jgi:hypothetical protein
MFNFYFADKPYSRIKQKIFQEGEYLMRPVLFWIEKRPPNVVGTAFVEEIGQVT